MADRERDTHIRTYIWMDGEAETDGYTVRTAR